MNYYNKTLRFPKFVDNGELIWLSPKQVNKFIRDEVAVFAMFALLQSDGEATNVELPMVCEFPKVSPKDISDFPPEREV